MSYIPRYTLAQIRCFVVIADTLHFGVAADRLGIKQSSLSRSLAALEAAVGATLIHRTSRRVELSEIGLQMLPQAKKTIEATDRFVASATGADETLGSFRLGVVPTLAPRVIRAVLPTIRTNYPGIALHAIEDQAPDLTRLLHAGDLDAVIVPLPCVPASWFVEVDLYRDDFLLLVPHDDPLAGNRSVSLSILQERTVMRIDETRDIANELSMNGTRTGLLEPMAHARGITVETAIQWVVGGLGVSLIPESALDMRTLSASVAAVRFTSVVPSRRIGIVYGGPSALSAQSVQIIYRIARELRWQNSLRRRVPVS
ncbi:LysR family transcriptional regulator [Rhodococcus sp. WS3]|uniref:LysR family transcriptional regulator n=1 Tax=Rhodococcus sp. WS3 TaxID=2486271 RepID=UPI0011422DA8|nr:LysR family transcriptional regulator [Rhodococcus sp. WS3]ROZ48987.1 LysR family transcriptional regulator [Rhodococcus sp. WS3]